MLLSLDADAQPTVDDESSQCGSASLQEVANMVETLASNHQQVRDRINGVRKIIASECVKTNETTLVNEIRDVKRTIASRCQDANETMFAEVAKEIKDEITGMKRLIGSGSEDGNETRLEEVVNMIGVIASNQQENTNEIRDVKRLLVSGNETRLEAVVEEMKGEIADEIRDVKRNIAPGCEEANETRLAEIEKAVKESKEEMKDEISGVKNETNRVLDVLENVVNAIKIIASNQQKNADELREVKRLNVLVLSQVKRLLASNQSACECVNSTCPSPAAQQDTAPVVVNSTDCIPMPTTFSPPESSSKQALVSALVCEYQRLLSVKHYCTD